MVNGEAVMRELSGFETKVLRPTIKHVAEASGHAPGTVSKASNLLPEQCSLLPATREHILAVAERVVVGAWCQVPQQVSVGTFNDVYPAPHVIPPLTTVAVSTSRMGTVAAELILQAMASDGCGPHEVMLPESLVIRQSTAKPYSN